ncbi:MAG: hypothetical protein NZO16_01580 [Deltaproteobacteria bacterium]|nr:hypothetical protein [Deltaproteobacteria bacterium]
MNPQFEPDFCARSEKLGVVYEGYELPAHELQVLTRLAEILNRKVNIFLNYDGGLFLQLDDTEVRIFCQPNEIIAVVIHCLNHIVTSICSQLLRDDENLGLSVDQFFNRIIGELEELNVDCEYPKLFYRDSEGNPNFRDTIPVGGRFRAYKAAEQIMQFFLDKLGLGEFAYIGGVELELGVVRFEEDGTRYSPRWVVVPNTNTERSGEARYRVVPSGSVIGVVPLDRFVVVDPFVNEELRERALMEFLNILAGYYREKLEEYYPHGNLSGWISAHAGAWHYALAQFIGQENLPYLLTAFSEVLENIISRIQNGGIITEDDPQIRMHVTDYANLMALIVGFCHFVKNRSEHSNNFDLVYLAPTTNHRTLKQFFDYVTGYFLQVIRPALTGEGFSGDEEANEIHRALFGKEENH